jgi:hypothetical protein
VESDSYSDIIIYGDTYPKTNKSGNCEFANVPIDLNTTFYFSGVSTSMPVPIAFSLSTIIDESAEVVETPMDKAKRLIAALPADPFDITIDDTAAILEATAAYEALTDEQKAELCDASKASSIIANSHSYGRYLESAQWTLDSLKPVDNATTLADGTYTGQVGAVNHYNCADKEDWLKMDMTCYWRKNNEGSYVKAFEREYDYYWWATGFVKGQLTKYTAPRTELKLKSRITFKSVEMANLFVEGMKQSGFARALGSDQLVDDTYFQKDADVWFLWKTKYHDCFVGYEGRN